MGAIREIADEIRDLDPTARECRKLALVLLGALAIIGALALWRLGPAGWWVLAAAGLVGAWGLLWPAGFKPLYIVWMSLALVMGFIMSRVLLTLLFYLAITPTGLVMRLVGRRPLDLKMGDRDSYWHRRDKPYDPADSEKMF